VKPNADSDIITSTAKEETKNLTSNDILTLCGGSMNIGKNDSTKGLHCISQLVNSRSNMNVMVMSALHRFDLSTTLCVNEEVKVFNRKLQKVAKMFKHVQVISMSGHRDHYTNHGLHMNGAGKDWTASSFATKIEKSLYGEEPHLPSCSN
jgi:hypothetical protein